VSVLNVALGLINLCGGGEILFSVDLLDVFRGGGSCLGGNTQGVGSHIGDKTHGAHSGNVDALV